MGGEVRKILCNKSFRIVDLVQLSLNSFLTESSMFGNKLEMFCLDSWSKPAWWNVLRQMRLPTFDVKLFKPPKLWNIRWGVILTSFPFWRRILCDSWVGFPVNEQLYSSSIVSISCSCKQHQEIYPTNERHPIQDRYWINCVDCWGQRTHRQTKTAVINYLYYQTRFSQNLPNLDFALTSSILLSLTRSFETTRLLNSDVSLINFFWHVTR